MHKEINSIQVLRGIAALLVVIFHGQLLMDAYVQRYGLAPAWLNTQEALRSLGQCGVDIFFVISGFIMAYITRGKAEQPGYAREFLRRRLIRIVPLYWFYTSVMAALLLLWPHLFSRATFDASALLLSYLFIPYTPAGANIAPVLTVGWTLSYEMYFYLLVALGLFFSRRQFLIGLGCFFSVCVLLHSRVSGPVPMLLTNPLLLEFFAGYALGVAYTRGIRLPTWLALACMVCGVLLFYAGNAGVTEASRAWVLGPPALLLVAGSVFWEKNTGVLFPRWAIALGDSSYSLYLSHFLLLPGIGKVFAALGLVRAVPPDALILGMALCCCLGGYASYRLLELPVLHFLSKKSR